MLRTVGKCTARVSFEVQSWWAFKNDKNVCPHIGEPIPLELQWLRATISELLASFRLNYVQIYVIINVQNAFRVPQPLTLTHRGRSTHAHVRVEFMVCRCLRHIMALSQSNQSLLKLTFVNRTISLNVQCSNNLKIHSSQASSPRPWQRPGSTVIPRLAGVRTTELKSTYVICFLYSGAQLICRLGCDLD